MKLTLRNISDEPAQFYMGGIPAHDFVIRLTTLGANPRVDFSTDPVQWMTWAAWGHRSALPLLSNSKIHHGQAQFL